MARRIFLLFKPSFPEEKCGCLGQVGSRLIPEPHRSGGRSGAYRFAPEVAARPFRVR